MSSGGPAKVLLVDDQVENLIALEAVLEPLGQTLVRAQSGHEALGHLLRDEFALILMDVQMPDLDGFETAAYIKRREKTRHIPIIFLTAISKELHHVFRGYSAGAVDYVLKPFDPLVLRSKVAVFIDLFEKERALRESERRFRTAFEHAPIGIALMSLEGRFVDVNRALLAMLDRSHADVLRQAPGALIHPDDRAVQSDHLSRIESGELSGFSAEIRFVRPAGELVPTLVGASVVPDEDGTPLHVIVQVTDLTERHAAERERDRRQLEQGARREAEAVAATLGKLQGVTDVALAHLGFDELVAALLPRLVETLDADAAGIIVLDTDHGVTTASGAALLPGGAIERGDRIPMPQDARRLAGLDDASARSVIEDTDVLHPLLRESGVQSLAAAPLALEHGMTGAIQVGTLRAREFTAQEVSLLSLLADRTALAVRHARRYEHERGVVETLQRSLLPPSLPLVPGFMMAARYLPAQADAQVGGDWYDVIVLEEGRVAVAIGDVSGHGIRAAALMGQLRNALRAYAFEGYPPSVAASRLDSLVRHVESGWFATFAHAVVEPESDKVTIANAGHPSPLLVSPEGSARFLDDGRGSPLGTARTEDAYDEATYDLPAGSLLFFYTDGLVERRGKPLLDSLEYLRSVVEDGPADPEALCDHVRAALLGEDPPRDDVAFVAIRMIPLTEKELKLTMPAEPKTLVAARSIVGRWLTAAGADDQAVRDLQMAAHEACANVIEHAYRFREATFELEGEVADGTAVLRIRDTGGWRGAGNPDRGRGFAMMKSLVDDIDVERDEGGTTVTLRRSLKRGVSARKPRSDRDGRGKPRRGARQGASSGTSRDRPAG
ncbi:MAG: SpoIIE family protein phosphatase [Thermoleophilaceae bacterium]